ncbi:hypothetical protein V8E36_003717 [Tilletia maclaganii]
MSSQPEPPSSFPRCLRRSSSTSSANSFGAISTLNLSEPSSTGDTRRNTWSLFIQNWSEEYNDAVRQGGSMPSFNALVLESEPSENTWQSLLAGTHSSQISVKSLPPPGPQDNSPAAPTRPTGRPSTSAGVGSYRPQRARKKPSMLSDYETDSPSSNESAISDYSRRRRDYTSSPNPHRSCAAVLSLAQQRSVDAQYCAASAAALGTGPSKYIQCWSNSWHSYTIDPKGKGKAVQKKHANKKRRPRSPSPKARSAAKKARKDLKHMSTLERKEMKLAMEQRHGDSDIELTVSSDSDDEGSADKRRFVPFSSSSSDGSEAEAELDLRSVSKKGSSSSKAKAKSATKVRSKKHVDKAAKMMARSSGQGTATAGDSDTESVPDMDGDGDKPAKTRGIGSRGSVDATYFIPGKIRQEPRIEPKKQHKYLATIQMFRCRCCEVDVPVVDNKPSRLALHFNGTTSACKRKHDPKDSAMRDVLAPCTGPAKQVRAATGGGGMTPAGQSMPVVKNTPPNNRAFVSPGLSPIPGWLQEGKARSNQLVTSVTRLRATAWIISEAIPFSVFESSKLLVAGPGVLPAFKSARTTKRDCGLLFDNIFSQAIKELSRNVFSLSVDEWTTPGMQYGFHGLVATYITSDWQYKSYCVDFQVLRGRHIGSLFAGHIVDFLTKHGLLDNWSGVIASDSASSNTRMSVLIADYLMENKLRPKYATDIPRNHVCCFAHHLNLAVQALYSGLGTPAEEKTRRTKVLAPVAASYDEEDDDSDAVAVPETWSDAGEDDDSDKAAEGAGQGGATDPDVDRGRNESDDEEEEEAAALRADMVFMPSRLSTIPEAEEEEDGAPEKDTPRITAEDSQGEDEVAPSSAQPGLSPLMKVAKIVEIARKSPERRRKYLRTARQAYKGNPTKATKVLIPPAFNKTRWNSRYHQLLAAVRFAKGMVYVTRANPGDDYPAELILKAKEVKQLERLVNLLACFTGVTLEMEKREPKATVVLRWHAKLAQELEQTRENVIASGDGSGQQTGAAISKALKKLDLYRARALECDAFLLAAILHPGRRATKLEAEYGAEVAKRAKDLLWAELGREATEASVVVPPKPKQGDGAKSRWARDVSPDAAAPDNADELTQGLSRNLAADFANECQIVEHDDNPLCMSRGGVTVEDGTDMT